MTRVSVRDLVKRYEGGLVAVDHMSFDVADGELVTLLGPSGCGKTTALRLIAGLETPDAGEIAFDDTLVTSVARGIDVPPEQRRAGMVFQSYAIWPHMTVFANVAYPLRVRGMHGPRVQRSVEEVLEAVGLLHLRDRLATKLSGGQQQRVAIARAIVGEPRLLLLDEPLSNLDARLRAHMRVELRDLQRRLGITSVYVTHDQLEAMVLSDRVIVMDAGSIQQVGTPREIHTRPTNQFVAGFVGYNNFIPARVLEQRADALVVRPLPDGPALRCAPAAFGPPDGQVVLAARGSSFELSATPFADADNTLTGRVTAELYLGSATEYHVEVGALTLTAAQSEREAHGANGRAALAVGAPAYLRIAPEFLVPLPP